MADESSKGAPENAPEERKRPRQSDIYARLGLGARIVEETTKPERSGMFGFFRKKKEAPAEEIPREKVPRPAFAADDWPAPTHAMEPEPAPAPESPAPRTPAEPDDEGEDEGDDSPEGPQEGDARRTNVIRIPSLSGIAGFIKSHMNERGLVSLLIFLIVFVGMFVWDDILPERKAPAPGPSYTVETVTLEDHELGIRMEVPKRWGAWRSSTRYSFTEAIKEYTFQDEPLVRLVALTPHYENDAWAISRGLSAGRDPRAFCESYLTFRRAGEEHRFDGGEDLFRSGGTYAYGDCLAPIPSVNMAIKEPIDYSEGWISVDAPRKAASHMRLARGEFFALDAAPYSALTLAVDLPDWKSEGYCVWRASLGGDEARLVKNYACMNYDEKNEAERRVHSYATSPLAVEAAKAAASLSSRTAGSAAAYAERFVEKEEHVDQALGVAFEYPSVFAAPTYDPKTRELTFPNDSERAFIVRATTKKEASDDERAAGLKRPEDIDWRGELCDGPCIEPWADPELWQKDKDALSGKAGRIACPASRRSMAGQYGVSCEIASLGGQKALVRYFAGHVSEGVIEKEYVFYGDGGARRYDVFVHSDAVRTPDLGEYRLLEESDLALLVANRMAKSVVLTR